MSNICNVSYSLNDKICLKNNQFKDLMRIKNNKLTTLQNFIFLPSQSCSKLYYSLTFVRRPKFFSRKKPGVFRSDGIRCVFIL